MYLNIFQMITVKFNQCISYIHNLCSWNIVHISKCLKPIQATTDTYVFSLATLLQ